MPCSFQQCRVVRCSFVQSSVTEMLLQSATLLLCATHEPIAASGSHTLVSTNICLLQVLVDPPSVAQTASILRGLRERYELHHGVRISDSALVEAANLADRCAFELQT